MSFSSVRATIALEAEASAMPASVIDVSSRTGCTRTPSGATSITATPRTREPPPPPPPPPLSSASSRFEPPPPQPTPSP